MWHASINTTPPTVQEVRKEFPPALSNIIARLMNKPVAQRYSSAAELLEDLSHAQEEINTPIAHAPTPTARTSTPAPPATTNPTASTSPPSPLPATPSPTAEAAPAQKPTAPSIRYWIRSRGKVTGPFDFPTLQRHAKQGTLSRFHQVSTDQLTWKPASEIEALYGPTIV